MVEYSPNHSPDLIQCFQRSTLKGTRFKFVNATLKRVHPLMKLPEDSNSGRFAWSSTGIGKNFFFENVLNKKY